LFDKTHSGLTLQQQRRKSETRMGRRYSEIAYNLKSGTCKSKSQRGTFTNCFCL